MNYSFEYIDIILLAMIAGFIFLRLRGILGKKTGFEGKFPSPIEKEFQKTNITPKPVSTNFDEQSQKEFLKGELATDQRGNGKSKRHCKPNVAYVQQRRMQN